MTTDRIIIQDLRLRTRIGIRDWEKEKPQDVVINITLHHQRRRAGETDNIEDAIDYKVIKDEIISLVEGAQYALIERLAQAIADECLRHDGVESADVRVDKPAALRFADSVAVRIVRP